MFKIGLFTFGGGYAMVAILERDLVEKKKWLEHDEFMDVIAIAESTPGPIAINSATYVGYKQAGFWGSFFATLGVVLPSFIVIFVISIFFDQFMSLEYVQYAFKGISACVIFLIVSAGLKMFKKLKKNWYNLVVFFVVLVALILLTIFDVSYSAIYFVLGGGALGIVLYLIGFFQNKKKIKNSLAEISEDKIEEKSEETQYEQPQHEQDDKDEQVKSVEKEGE